ncbi:phage tail tape measure protein [Streptomyces sp. NPDC046915]|uniref:phage tail tape measure protein n=1 Tax=Streptomyces sp. NPDC046915 TaxID=3155257 RepID=UPI0034066CF0
MASTGIIYRLVAHDSASRTFDRVGRAAGRTDTMLARMGRTAKLAGEAVAVGLAAGLAKGTQDAARFQAEMTRISTQAGGTAKDVKTLSDQVLKLGTTTQQGPQHLAESLYHLKSVGMDNVSAMKALKEASDLAAVGHANLEETTNALAGAWRTGIKGATSFHEAVSTVNAIIGAGNMSMDQFNAAIGTGILPSAKTFGLSMKQVGAALALMTDEGIDSASAATRLRMSFSLLGAPSGAAEKQLKKIGLTGLNLADAMRGPKGLIGAISLLKEHLDKSGMSASKQSQLLSRAFGGGRSSSGILLMLNNLDVLEKKQEQINRSTGKFDDAVKMQRKTAEAQWHLLTSNLEVMGIRVGAKVLPPITAFVKFLAGTAMPAAARFGQAMASMIPVAQIKGALDEVRSTVGGFLDGLTGGSGFGGLFKGLTGGSPKAAKNPIDKFPTTVLGIGTGAPHLGSGQASSTRGSGKALQQLPHYGVGQVAPANGRIATARQFAGPHLGSGMVAPLVKAPKAAPKSAAEKLGETLRKAVSGGIETVDWSKLGSVLGKGLGDAIGWVGKHTADFTKKIGKILGGLDFVEIGKGFGSAAIPLAIGFITNLFAPLFSLDFWKKHWLDTIIAVLSVIPIGRIAGALGKVFEHIPFLKVFEPLLRGVGRLGGWLEKAIGKSVLRPLGRLGKAIWDGIVKGFTKVLPGAAGKVSELVGKVAVGIVAYTGRFIGAGERLIGGLGRGILKFGGKIGEWIGKIIGWIVKPFARAGGWLLERGKAVVRGLKDGVVNAAKGIGSWMWRNVGRPVTNAFRNAGSWVWSKGKALVSGFKNGIISGAAKIGSWSYRTIIRPSVDVFANAGKWVWGKGKALVGGFKGGVVNGATKIGGWTKSHVIDPVTGTFSRAGSWLVSKGGQLISGLKNGIVGGIKGIGKWIKSNIIDPVVSAVKHFFGIRSPSRVFMSIGGHLVSGLMKGMAKTSGTAIAKKVFGSLPAALGSIVKKGLVSIASLPGKALSALGKLGGFFKGLFGGGGGGGVGGNVSRWAGDVASVLQMLGAPATALPAVLKRIQIESGGNPNAINLTDSNARAGHPSQGLMQTIPSTFAAYAGPFRSRGITDPLASIYAGVNYAMHAYGSNWINVMTRPGGYAKGTSGAARGLAWVGEKGPELVNFKGGEDVLSHQQSMAFAKARGIRLPGYASGTILNAADRVRRDKQKVEDAKDAVAAAKRRHKGVAAAEKRLEAARKELQAANIALRNAQRSAKTSISNTIATGLLKKLETGTSSAIASAIKSLATKLLNAGFNRTAASVQKKGGQLEKLASKRASITKTIAEANQYAADQAGNIKDFLSISGTSATGIGDLISQAGAQQKTASNFVALTKSLKARGASKELLQQLSDAGPGSQLATILGQKSVTTTDISKLNKLMASGGKLASSFGKDMADLMYDSGKDAGKGFLAGLKAQEKALGKQMAKLAKDLIAQIKHALKIKSPSVVMRDEIGKNVVLGMAHGIDLHSHLVGGAAQRLADTATGVSLRRRYVPTAASGQASARQEAAWDRLAAALEAAGSGSEVHVHFNDDRLRDLIDVQVKPKIKASEDRQAFRARVGRRSG